MSDAPALPVGRARRSMVRPARRAARSDRSARAGMAACRPLVCRPAGSAVDASHAGRNRATVHDCRLDGRLLEGPLVSRVRKSVTNFPERGARLARRDSREYREYLSEEQRSQTGCPARKMSANFELGTLAERSHSNRCCHPPCWASVPPVRAKQIGMTCRAQRGDVNPIRRYPRPLELKTRGGPAIEEPMVRAAYL